jgi:hypothetical protein
MLVEENWKMDITTFAAGAFALAVAASQPAVSSNHSAGYQNSPAPKVHVEQVRYNERLPLPRILRKLSKRGFYDFKDVKWGNDVYRIKARGPRGKLVRVVVNAYDGDIIDIQRIEPRRYRSWGYGGGYGGWSGNYGNYGGSGRDGRY